MMIPVNTPKIYPEMYALTHQALDSGWLSAEGPMVKKFEHEFAKYIGVPFASATNSGTAALHLAIAALGLGKGDEVLVPSLTIASCYFAVCYTGATPVPVDVDPATYTINPDLISRLITKHTKAIMPVHLYGHPCDMDPIMEIAKKHHLYVIEDAAEAHGAEYKGRRVGSIGDISIFSFYANKIVTCGEGGIILTKHKALYQKITHLKNLSHTKQKRFVHDGVGFNYQLSNLQAAVGLASLAHIQTSLQTKQLMARQYEKGLREIPGIILPVERPWAKNVYWMYAIRVEKKRFGMNRDRLMKSLMDKGIQTRTFFFSPKTAYRKLHLFKTTNCPVAQKAEREGLYLPSGLGTTNNERADVIKNIKQICCRPS